MTSDRTSSQPDTHANHSALPGSREARKMTATSGRRCCGSLNSADPLGSLLKTLVVTSVWDSTMCYLTWKVKATPRGRLLFQLVPSMPRTDETGSGLLATPTATANQMAPCMRHRVGGMVGNPNTAGRRQSDEKMARVSPEQPHRTGVQSRENDTYAVPPGTQKFVYATESGHPRQFSGIPDKAGAVNWWSFEPAVGRVADGIPNRVQRLKALGNAVVPQIPEIIGLQYPPVVYVPGREL